MATSTKTEILAEPGVPQIVIVRAFDAPPELVFRAFTDPELLPQWLGPRDQTMTIDYYEYRDGGRWRFVHRTANGDETAFRGVIHGTPSLEGFVRTFEFEGYPGHVSLETLTLEERGGKTRARINSVFQTVEDRDGTVRSGMEHGLNESLEKLDELLARLVAAR
jgi:uncharacterized protein YndB with AHSA1/START domain